VREQTKSPASTAPVPRLPALARELRAHRSRQASRDLRALHAAGTSAGLNPEGAEPVGLHDLRHSFVALALDGGLTLAEAAVLARHTNAK
jgi:integrase